MSFSRVWSGRSSKGKKEAASGTVVCITMLPADIRYSKLVYAVYTITVSHKMYVCMCETKCIDCTRSGLLSHELHCLSLKHIFQGWFLDYCTLHLNCDIENILPQCCIIPVAALYWNEIYIIKNPGFVNIYPNRFLLLF